MFTREEIILKIGKLLRLSTSSNPNESALAAAMAQRLMDQYEIDKAMLDETNPNEQEPDEEIMNFGSKDAPLDMERKIASWKIFLASCVARFNSCRIYLESMRYQPRKIQIVGRPSDVQTVRYLFEYLKHEVDRLTHENGKGCGRTWCNNFRLGVVDAVKEKLTEGRKQTIESTRIQNTGNTQAMVKVEKAIARFEEKSKAVDSWMKENLKLRSSGYSRSSGDASARQQGRKAGHSINIGRAKGALGSGTKMITG